MGRNNHDFEERNNMKTYNVHFMSPMLSWEGVEANSEQEAIEQCEIDDRIDLSDGPFRFIAEEIDDNEEEDETISKR